MVSLWSEWQGNFAPLRDFRLLRLTSKLVDLRRGNVNLLLPRKTESNWHSIPIKNRPYQNGKVCFWSEWNIRQRRNKIRFAKANIEAWNLTWKEKDAWSLRDKRPLMVGMTGFEPATSCSQSTRATNCATSRKNKGLSFSVPWCSCGESNSGHLD